MGWFYSIILATLIYGVINFLYKAGAEKKYPPSLMVNFQASTVAVLALAALLATKQHFIDMHTLILLALANSFFWSSGTVLKISALKKIPVNVAMPLNKLNSVFVILIGLVFFGDRPGPRQVVGMVLAVGVLMLLSGSRGSVAKSAAVPPKEYRTGVLFILAAAVCIALSMTVGKIAAMKVQKLNYIFVSYTFAALFTAAERKILVPPARKASADKTGAGALGAVCGVLNFFGYWLVLHAWSKGPLSLIQAVLSTTMVITIILAAIFYGEKFTPKNIIAIIFSIVAVILIKG